MHKGLSVMLTADFSSEAIRPEGSGMTLFKMLKEKDCQSRAVHPEKLSFKKKKEKLRHFPINKNCKNISLTDRSFIF